MSTMLRPQQPSSIVCPAGAGASGGERQDTGGAAAQLLASATPGTAAAVTINSNGCSDQQDLQQQQHQQPVAVAVERNQYEMFDTSVAGSGGKRPTHGFNIDSILSRSQSQYPGGAGAAAAAMTPVAAVTCYSSHTPSSSDMQQQVYHQSTGAEIKPAAASALPTWPAQSMATGQVNGSRPAYDMFSAGAAAAAAATPAMAPVDPAAAAAAAQQSPRTGGPEAHGATVPLSHVTPQVFPVAYSSVKSYPNTPWLQSTWPTQAAAAAATNASHSPARPMSSPAMRYPDNVNVLMWHPMTMSSHMESYNNSTNAPQATLMNTSSASPLQPAGNPYYKPSPPFWIGPGGSEYAMQQPAPPSLDLRYAFPAAALTFHGRTARLVSPMYRPQISETHRPVTCKLQNADLWQVFNRHTTEMVITKAGRRMFPIIEAKLEGLYPERSYAVVVDIVPADQYHWKFTGTEWRIGGPRCEPPMPSRLYVHQESPSSGLHWMQDVISFGKLKITNDKATAGHEIVLDSLHKYVVRLHVACFHHASDYAEVVHTCVFNETSFIAVTAYQNNQMTQLKIEHNPFAKGFREGSAGRPSSRRPRNRSDDKTSEENGGDKSPLSAEEVGAHGSINGSWDLRPRPRPARVDADMIGEAPSSLDSV
uniref:T-box transcription factor A SciTbxA n=1 Tax=Sycon ciliatum TaxID=27933 RepID=A0A077SN37_9METZ|nr:T-box transcription factor A SciTbxA [Sycon ciliatum]|eukprot:scpid62591/ scgid17622/ T-box transcription factor TBX4